MTEFAVALPVVRTHPAIRRAIPLPTPEARGLAFRIFLGLRTAFGREIQASVSGLDYILHCWEARRGSFGPEDTL
jgi:hypothetical protein